jgi:AcrR family transcriptional regulator
MNPRREAEVLEAAVTVFHRDGYDAASVQSVANELGILRGSLYHYIETKEDLLFRNLLGAHRDIEAILNDVRRLDVGPAEKLREYARRQIEYIMRNSRRMAIYHRDIGKLSEERRRLLSSGWRAHERFVVDCIAGAQAHGDADPRIVSRCLFASMAGVSQWYRPTSRHAPAELARQCADFAVAGALRV